MPPRTDRAVTGPVRTCVGCRGRAAQDELLRVGLVDGRALPDPRRRLPGRGAYVHPDVWCVRNARKRRVWQRALRARGPVDPQPVEEALDSRGVMAGEAYNTPVEPR